MIFNESEHVKEYQSKRPEKCPADGTNEYIQLQKLCDKVEIILHTVGDSEYQAAATFMKPPADNFSKAILLSNSMVIGTVSNKKTALVQTDPGQTGTNFMQEAINKFPNAQLVIAVGICYAFDNDKYKFGDVLVSDKISNLNSIKFDENGEIKEHDQTLEVHFNIRNIFCKDRCHYPEFNVSEIRTSKVYAGRLASYSPLLEKSTDNRNKFHAAVNTAIGGEILGTDLSKFSSSGSMKGVIIIKGVADHADEGSSPDKWKYTASRAAMHYIQSKLLYTQGPIFKPGKEAIIIMVHQVMHSYYYYIQS